MEVHVVIATATMQTVTTVQITDRKDFTAQKKLVMCVGRPVTQLKIVHKLKSALNGHEEIDILLKIVMQEQMRIIRIGDLLVHLWEGAEGSTKGDMGALQAEEAIHVDERRQSIEY